jgi:hypothetical protein
MQRVIVAALLALAATAAAQDEPRNGLHVTGHGAVTQEPDVARFTFEVVRQGNDAAALKREVDRITAAVVALAEGLGVARADVTAAVIEVRPEYRYVDGRSLLEGVNVSRTIAVKLRDLERYGDLSTGAVDAGVNQILGVSLDVDDRHAIERKALDAAIADAAGEAAHVAGELGMKLGRVLEVHVDEDMPVAMPMVGALAMREKTDDFRPGVIEVTRSVRLRYELELR